MSDVESEILKEFNKESADGIINVKQAENALQRCKFVNLTPFQIHILIGLSDCDGDGIVEALKFAKICADYIEVEFNFDAMCKK